MGAIHIEQKDRVRVDEQIVEFVERKGVGHPDSLIDGIVENVSLELNKEYIENAGRILHHNVDKGLIIGGSSEVEFGKGVITKPIEVIVAGRATQDFQNERIAVDEIAKKAALDYLREHTRFLDLEKEVVIVPKIMKGSGDLNEIFARATEMPLANDTSFGLGFAPFTETERLTLETERFLNGKDYKRAMEMVGEDVKVMGVRENDSITLTVAIAFVARFINSIDEYAAAKERIAKDILGNAKKITSKEVSIAINNGDSHELGEVYLTKSGLSCESGDDGAVGRGNRVNGLITPFRHMSLEAAAGKNPVNHVGKIYSIVSREIAQDIVKLYPMIRECNVAMVSQIGRKINDPKSLYIEAIMERGERLDPISSKVRDIASETVSNMSYITEELARGKYEMF
ncbi:MAG: methionine adenosyltransferase [Candidatus Micrarchaeota archaeon]|nr:methionine adenosyltransferase [Candidatus Micrarchaeota archaeon]